MGPGLCRKVAGWAARPAPQNGRAPLSAPKTGGFMERGCIGNSHRQNLSSTQQHATGQQTPGMRDLAARARGSCLDASLAVHPTPGAAAERKMWAHCFESREGLELDRNFSFRRICRRERTCFLLAKSVRTWNIPSLPHALSQVEATAAINTTVHAASGGVELAGEGSHVSGLPMRHHTETQTPSPSQRKRAEPRRN